MRALKTVLLAIAMIAANYLVFAFVLQDLWWCEAIGPAGKEDRILFVVSCLVTLVTIPLFTILELI